MVQFQTAIQNFAQRYRSYAQGYGPETWITKELVAELEQLPEPHDDED
jgi:hypothetical protein